MTNRLLGHYRPGRGGHAPGHLRDAFEQAVEAVASWDGTMPAPMVEVGDDEVEMPVTKLCGILWNCIDTVPRHLHEAVKDLVDAEYHDAAIGGSYAACAQALRFYMVLQAQTLPLKDAIDVLEKGVTEDAPRAAP